MARYITLYNGKRHTYGEGGINLDEHTLGAHLSKICRFAGATTILYTIAQHSVFVADVLALKGVPPLTQLKALLHDGHESLTSDMPTPYQQWIADLIEERFGERYDVIEHSKQILDVSVYGAFGLATPTYTEANWIKLADTVALITEAHQLLDPVPQWVDAYAVKPIDKAIVPLNSEDAARAFVAKFKQLRHECAQAA